MCVLSNWHFNKELYDSNTLRACKPSDVNVALKFSSTEFVNEKNKDHPYHFDKCGAVLPFASFVSLMKDQAFVKTFMQQVKSKFEESEGSLDLEDISNVDAIPAQIVETIYDNDDVLEDDDNKRNKNKTASAATVVPEIRDDDEDEDHEFSLPPRKTGKRNKRNLILDGE